MKDVIIRHFRSDDEGALTVVYKIIENDFLIGWSFCSYKDSFSRKKGIEIASERLEKNPITAKNRNVHDYCEINLLLLSAVYSSEHVPNSSRVLMIELFGDCFLDFINIE